MLYNGFALFLVIYSFLIYKFIYILIRGLPAEFKHSLECTKLKLFGGKWLYDQFITRLIILLITFAIFSFFLKNIKGFSLFLAVTTGFMAMASLIAFYLSICAPSILYVHTIFYILLVLSGIPYMMQVDEKLLIKTNPVE